MGAHGRSLVRLGPSDAVRWPWISGVHGVHIGVYQWYLIMQNGIFQYKALNLLSQDKKRGFGICPTFAKSPCAGFEVQGAHQHPDASKLIF
jgi:hypothetical protein